MLIKDLEYINISSLYIDIIEYAISNVFPCSAVGSLMLEPLIGGFSKAKIFKFSVNDQNYVLRLLDKNKRPEKRLSELNAHQIAADLGISPKIHYINSKSDPLVVIMDYIDGRPFLKEDLNDNVIIQNIMDSIKKFHNHAGYIVTKKSKIDSMQKNYEDALQKGAVYPSDFERLYKELKNDLKWRNSQLKPSHGDLNLDNIMILNNKKIMLIDWAESKIDNPFLDIGWFSCLSGASIQQTTNMLEKYISKNATKTDIKDIMFFQNAARFYLATYWIGKQKEKSVATLDKILDSKIRVDLSKKIIDLDDENFTKSALSWLKEYKQNQYLYKN